jgi:WD40 repeat protein/serine/threonine protein kinase
VPAQDLDLREKTPRAIPPPRAGQLPPLPAGTVIDHFQIVRCLGRGGMGVVYLARDFKLGRRVALKLIDPALARSPEAVALFLREARATACFNHPNIVTIHAVGQHGVLPYIALEYLEGQSLLERMNEQRAGTKEAIRTMLGIAEALREAHAHNIVHGDLKPANVFIPADGRPRVVDFGICRVIDACATREGMADEAPGQRIEPIYHDESSDTGLWLQPLNRPAAVGTPAYMAPEQWAPGKAVTGAADIWALGLILGEMVASFHPYERLLHPSLASTRELRQAVRAFEVAPVPDSLGPNVPDGVVQLMRACLRKRPADRPTAAEVVESLQQILADNKPSVGAPADVAPFPGLQPFSEAQSRFYFGREVDLAAFIERLRTQVVLPIVGPSHAGKSSFVYAGVIPRLKEQGRWVVVDLRPGNDPFATLAEQLVALSKDEPRNDDGAADSEQRRLWSELAASPALLALKLHTLAQRRGCRVLLFVDQLDELRQVPDPSLRRSFVEAICGAASDRDDPVRVVFTLRDDFLGQLAESPRAREALGHVTVLCRPGASELEQILTRPLQVVGFEYDDPALPQEIVTAVVGAPACLPLLQFTTRMLWERRDRAAHCLRRSAYEQIGGVAGALAVHADGVLDGLTPQQRAITRNILLRLVAPTGTRQVLRRDRLVEALGPEAEVVLARLTEARLVNVKQSDEEGAAELEIVHESLIHAWGQLARWINESKEELRFADDITRAANLWLSRGRNPEEAWGRDALHDAERMLARSTVQLPLPPQVHEFIGAARALERRKRRRRRGIIGAGVALVVCVGAAVSLALWALSERETLARWQRDRAQSGWAEAQREGARAAMLHGDLLEARAKLREALQTQDSTEARVLWRQLRQQPLRWRRTVGSIIYDVAPSPDGRSIAAVAQDHSIYILDAATSTPQVFRGHRDQVFSVAYSPDGSRLASGSLSGEILVWNTRGQITSRLLGHKGPVRTLAFGPDGKHLASASLDGTARVWDTASGAAPRVFRHERALEAVAFSTDGAMLASSGLDRIVRIWTLGGSSPPRQLAGHTQTVNSVAFSPDGKWLLSASDDRTARLWEVASGKASFVLGSGQPLLRARFSPDGQAIAASSLGGGILFWEASTGRQTFVLAEPSVLRFGVGGPRAPLLAAGGLDGVVRVWDVSDRMLGRAEAAPARTASNRPVNTVAYAQQGGLIASGGPDGVIRIWDAHTGEVRRLLSGHRDQVYSLAFSPDGKLLASASWDATLRLWDAATGAPGRTLVGHQAAVLNVAFSRDGSRLLSGGRDGTARVWDVKTGREEVVLRGHNNEAVAGVAFGADAMVATASYDGKVRVWELQDAGVEPRLVAVLPHPNRPHSVAFDAEGIALATSCWDGGIRVWQLIDQSHRVLGRHQGRAYQVAWNAQGNVASVGADGFARVWRTQAGGGQRAVFAGHRGEVNDIALSPDGKHAVTVGDDGTVRIWELGTGAPVWKGVGLVGSPLQLYTHQGWRTVEYGKVKQGAWHAAVEGARYARAAGSTLCALTAAGNLEIWDLARDDRVRRDAMEAAGSVQMVPLRDGCLTLTGGHARLHRRGAAPREVAQQASAVAWDGKEILIAARGRVYFLDDQGSPLRSVDAAPNVAALAHDGRHLVLGFDEGNVLVLPASGGQAISLQDIAPSPVTALHLGPAPETVVVGFANGFLGIWSLRNGARLEQTQLHGAVTHLVARQARIHLATELGDHTTLDLDVLREPYCSLMREVWAQVPVVWQHGLPAVQPAPADHACKK